MLELLQAIPFLLLVLFLGFLFKKVFRRSKWLNKYFFPALGIKLFGALSITLIYKYYYGYGDIFLYFEAGTVIHESFLESFSKGMNVFLDMDWLKYASSKYSGTLHLYVNETNIMVMRMAGIFSMLSFNNLYIVSIWFALFSFAGVFAMYSTMLRLFPDIPKMLAAACFFIPSVIFWGSGILKDSLTLGALGWVFWGFHHLVIIRKRVFLGALLLLFGSWMISEIKFYILLTFAPGLLYWGVREYHKKIRWKILRQVTLPVFLILSIGAAGFGIVQLMETSNLSFDMLVYKSQYQKYHLARSGAGSAYTISSVDGSPASILKVAPEALVVTLFRPFFWEINGVLMLMAAAEALYFLILTFKVIGNGLRYGGLWKSFTKYPVLQFFLFFSVLFSIGVGMSSGNFGSLVRYKIPVLPFYLTLLFALLNEIKKNKILRPGSSQERLRQKPKLQTTMEEG